MNGQGGRQLLPTPTGIGAAVLVDQPTGGDPDQPGQRRVRQSHRPLHGRGGQRLLHRILSLGEPAVAAGDRAEGLRTELAEQSLDVRPGSHLRIRSAQHLAHLDRLLDRDATGSR